MAYIDFGNQQIEITEDEYRRLRNRASRGGNPDMLALKNGVIVFKHKINAIIPSKMKQEQEERPQEPEPQVSVEQPPEEQTPGKLTSERLQEHLNASGLSKAAFAASVGYSPATIHVALKDGVLSQELSDAVIKKYGE